MRCGEPLDWMRKVGKKEKQSKEDREVQKVILLFYHPPPHLEALPATADAISALPPPRPYMRAPLQKSTAAMIANRSYGTVAAPTSGARHLERETPAPARYYSASASSCATAAAVSAASLQPAIPYFHGSLP
eukprot:scaffold9603_cov139-Ochromonas_danica.AAC.1